MAAALGNIGELHNIAEFKSAFDARAPKRRNLPLRRLQAAIFGGLEPQPPTSANTQHCRAGRAGADLNAAMLCISPMLTGLRANSSPGAGELRRSHLSHACRKNHQEQGTSGSHYA
jgi:hypothetical protein